MRRIWWRSVCIGRYQQKILNKFRYPYINLVVSLIFPMDVNNLTDRQTDKVSVSCKLFVLTSPYLLSNILQKLLSKIDIISHNCRTSHLKPVTVNAIQTVTQSVQSVSARLLIYCELLYRQRGTKNKVSLSFLNICACTSNTFFEHRTRWSTIPVCAA